MAYIKNIENALLRLGRKAILEQYSRRRATERVASKGLNLWVIVVDGIVACHYYTLIGRVIHHLQLALRAVEVNGACEGLLVADLAKGDLYFSEGGLGIAIDFFLPDGFGRWRLIPKHLRQKPLA